MENAAATSTDKERLLWLLKGCPHGVDRSLCPFANQQMMPPLMRKQYVQAISDDDVETMLMTHDVCEFLRQGEAADSESVSVLANIPEPSRVFQAFQTVMRHQRAAR